ncbi:hypothetical protein [Parasynechococcus sp.]|uniref:hypothetical protein n=1 Tax=Parasynechococcus sp. TaxID=3101203 RepID=UPI003704A855
MSPPRVRGALRVAAAVLGIGVTGWLLATLWPKPDRVAAGAPLSADQPETLAPFPEVPVKVLVIGVAADWLSAASKQAALSQSRCTAAASHCRPGAASGAPDPHGARRSAP